MQIGPGLVLVIGLMATVGVEAFASYLNSMFLPRQVVARWGQPGIAFVIHGGMWSDLLILPFLFRHILEQHLEEWSGRQIVFMAVCGMALTTGNQLSLMFNQEMPDPIGWKKEWLSLTIVPHFFYMSTLVALTGLFYFYSKADAWGVVVVSIALGVHMMAGMHVPVGVLQRFTQWSNVPDFLSNPLLPYFAGGVWIALILAATYAAGWRAGTSVATAALGLAAINAIILKFAPPGKV